MHRRSSSSACATTRFDTFENLLARYALSPQLGLSRTG